MDEPQRVAYHEGVAEMSGYELNKPPEPPPEEPKLSLLDDDVEQPCPSCGKPLPQGAVVCMLCGYDMLRGSKSRTELGEEEKPPEAEPIVREKGMKGPAALVWGAVQLLIAIVIGWWYMVPETPFGTHLDRSILIVLESATSLGTGLVAIWCAAWLLKRPLGRVDLAASRLFVVVTAFLMVFNVSIPIPFLAIGIILKVLAACAVYWLAVLLLIGRDARTTRYIAIGHAAATLTMFVQTFLWSGTFKWVMW